MASGGFGGGVPHQDYPLPWLANLASLSAESTGLDRGDVLNRTLQLQA